MTIVASGSAIGSIVHPLMINNRNVFPSSPDRKMLISVSVLKSGIGFANTVRISAAFVSVLLLGSCLLMRTRIQPPKSSLSVWKVTVNTVTDPLYVLATSGYVRPIRWSMNDG